MSISKGLASSAVYALSLHDALPISGDLEVEPGDAGHVVGGVAVAPRGLAQRGAARRPRPVPGVVLLRDRKSTRLNCSHRCISYAVFCLKKKKKETCLYDSLCATHRH